ncbi:PAS domain-containing protein [Streptomyces avermitilis]|uniref:PAS domain-containing protein n=1 Tax=Streptomyces avermitilis TaxID=33903 RepID=UPI00367C83E1
MGGRPGCHDALRPDSDAGRGLRRVRAVVLANPALAAEWNATPGSLRGADVLDLFRPQEPPQIERIAQTLRLRRRSRYPVSVRWDAADGTHRHGELTADPVSDSPDTLPALLVVVRVLGASPAPDAPPPASRGPDRGAAGRGRHHGPSRPETGLTTDGVTYHLRRLSERWSAANRTELVARAYALGVLSSGVWPPEAVTD